MMNMDKETDHTSLDSPQTDPAEFRYDPSEHTLGVRVIEAIGDVAGVDETEITTPLSEAVDPEALNALFADSVGGVVQFQFNEYTITITVSEDGTGQISIE